MVQKAEEEDETKTPRFFFLSVRCVCPEPILAMRRVFDPKAAHSHTGKGRVVLFGRLNTWSSPVPPCPRRRYKTP